MSCHRCNAMLPLSARTCYSCGAPVSAEAMFSSRPTAAADTSELERVRVGSYGAVLWDRPFLPARELARLEPHRTLKVIKRREGTIQVEVDDGRSGFVEESRVESIKQAS